MRAVHSRETSGPNGIPMLTANLPREFNHEVVFTAVRRLRHAAGAPALAPAAPIADRTAAWNSRPPVSAQDAVSSGRPEYTAYAYTLKNR